VPDLGTIVIGVLAVLVAVLVVSSQFGSVTVFEFQQGLRYRNGKFDRLVGPGRHWIRRGRTTIDVVDMRLTDMALQGQELVTSDGISVKISLAVQQRTTDPVAATHNVQSSHLALYNILQVALRETVSSMSIDDVLARRAEIGPAVLAKTVERARAFGVEIASVDVKDLMLPAATKRLLGQVVDARQKGLAALEKARGETAALRSLANAARMVESNPSLLQLRMLQQLESTSGNTVLVGMPSNTSPLPYRQVGPNAAAESTEPASEPEP
jgi:regulator of protease activity HflC (stomatin/prohibitin superfamily)